MDAGRVIRPLQAKLDEVKADGLNAMLCSTEIIEKVIALLKEDCHNCKLECLLQKYDELKEKHDALLKEHDAVEPINSYGTFRCGNCRNIVGYNDGHGRGYQNNFCSKCGKKVKWE